MNSLVSANHLPRLSAIAVFSIAMAFSLTSAAQQQQQEQPAASPHDMTHTHHNHGGFMQEGMHHAVAKGVTLDAKVDAAAHTVTLRVGPMNLPAHT